MSARGTVALFSAFALAAAASSCQVVIDVGDYHFDVEREETPNLPDSPDASSEPPPASPAPAGPDPGAPGRALDAGTDGGDGLTDAATPTPDTCDGCRVGTGCVAAGQSLSSNPCLVCDPAQSKSAYSIAVGRRCGDAASACSEQDRCDADGACAPKHLPEGTACNTVSAGAEPVIACDLPDTCDGAGTCVDRRAGDSTPCEDGQFCTTGDQCLAGQCAAGGPLSCGENQLCVEGARACQCAGCNVNGVCYPAGAGDGNPCFVCDPARSSTAFSASEGARCGDPDGECFGPRTCDSIGQCLSRPLGAGIPCGDQSTTACSGPDSCNGSGTCTPNHIGDFTSCEDGLFCTEGDFCQGGACTSGNQRFCGSQGFCIEEQGCVCFGQFCELSAQ